MAPRPKRLSEEEARRAWRYAVETEFHSIDPSKVTEKQILGHGTEERFLPFDHSVEKAWFTHSINANGQLLAIPDGENVDIYDLDTGDRTVMSGHISRVMKLGFSPTDPNLLVSWSETELRPNERHPEYNDIVIWNIREQQGLDPTRKPELIDNAAKAGVRAVEATLGPEMRMSMGERWDIIKCDNQTKRNSRSRAVNLSIGWTTQYHEPLSSVQ
jgi:WD40 repeat protein